MAVFKVEKCPLCKYHRRSTAGAGVCPKCGAAMVLSDNWYITYSKAGREIMEAVGPNRKTAEAVLAKQKTAIIEGKYFDKADDYTWDTAVDKFRKWYEVHTAPKTQAMYANSLKMLEPHFGEYYLSQITYEMVDDFKALRLMTVTNSTVNRDIATLKRLYSLMCDEWHLIRHNPMTAVKKLKENPSRVRFLTEREIARLIAACDKKAGRRSTWLKLAVLIALNTGMRKETITSLMWSEIDFAGGFIRAETKGGKKTNVPLGGELLAELEALRKERRSGKVLSTYLFPSHTDPRKPIRSDIHGSFDNACETAGIKDFRFHDLRHTFAKNFYQRTHDWKALTTILNHSDVSITMKIYINFDEGDLSAAMRVFNGTP